ncbi:DUF1269 domain-containing protein [Crocosphaera sp. Alani8]|uniref:DUF1269 domain-containing protein n=1 Tax=Crocosphaera sp. Alani8 TaxID=3038952 RepID=UPI00313B51CF
MSDLIVVGFDNELKADEVLYKLEEMQKEHLVDLEDAVVVIKNQKGKVKVKQTYDLVSAGALSGGMWGSLIGLLFLHPLLGVAAGIATGALGGILTDIGIDDEFIKNLAQTLEPGSSALFLLVQKATPDKVLDELRPLEGKVLQTSLSKSDEASLKAALEKAQVEA